MKLVAGLGNPGEEYENSRHNTGFIMLDFILGKKADWKESGKAKALYYREGSGKKEVEYLKPVSFMNNSGGPVLHAKENHKIKLSDIAVIYDDIDLPIGSMKISFNKSSGGHRGLESVIKKLKSKEFMRIRIGISPATPSGKLRKPKGEQAVLKFLLGKYKESELKELKKLSKKVAGALEAFVAEGKEKAMNLYN